MRDAGTSHPEQAEGLCAFAGEQLAGEQRVIVVLLDDLHDLFPRFLRHVRVPVDHAADGAAGNPRELCDIVAVDPFQADNPFCKRCSFCEPSSPCILKRWAAKVKRETRNPLKGLKSGVRRPKVVNTGLLR